MAACRFPSSGPSEALDVRSGPRALSSRRGATSSGIHSDFLAGALSSAPFPRSEAYRANGNHMRVPEHPTWRRERPMKPMYKTLLPGLAGVAMLVFMASGAAAQNLKEQIVGTWTPVSRDVTMREMKIVPFGSHPLGYYMFDSSGHFSINLVNPDVPKFASGNPNTGTPAR